MKQPERKTNMMMKVIMRAMDIPVGSRVTKIHGNKVYKLVDKINIYGEPAEPGGDFRRVTPLFGMRFMVEEKPSDGEDASVSAVSGDNELLWLVEDTELFDHLDEKLHGSDGD